MIALHSLYKSKPLKTKCPFITKAAMNSILFIHTNPHRVWHLQNSLFFSVEMLLEKHLESLLPFWALEQCEPQLMTSELSQLGFISPYNVF